MRKTLYRPVIGIIALFASASALADPQTLEREAAHADVPEIVVTSERETAADTKPALAKDEAEELIAGEVLAALNDRMAEKQQLVDQDS